MLSKRHFALASLNAFCLALIKPFSQLTTTAKPKAAPSHYSWRQTVTQQDVADFQLHVTAISGEAVVLWFTNGDLLWPIIYRSDALTQTLHAISCEPSMPSTSFWALSRTAAQEKFEFLLSQHIASETWPRQWEPET